MFIQLIKKHSPICPKTLAGIQVRFFYHAPMMFILLKPRW